MERINIQIHKVTDTDTLMEWRSEVISNVFGVMPDEALMAANRDYYLSHVPKGQHIAVIATFDGEDAGCGAICLTEELPSPDNPSGKCAYLMNIYVRKRFREQGIAHHIVTNLIQTAKEMKCGKIYLESTDEAKKLYSACGFMDMENMMKYDEIAVK